MMEFNFPDRNRFAGTICFDCAEYERCVLVKGHCFRDCLKVSGKIYDVNPYCPLSDPPPRRIY
jgi:hypothetical protein